MTSCATADRANFPLRLITCKSRQNEQRSMIICKINREQMQTIRTAKPWFSFATRLIKLVKIRLKERESRLVSPTSSWTQVPRLTIHFQNLKTFKKESTKSKRTFFVRLHKTKTRTFWRTNSTFKIKLTVNLPINLHQINSYRIKKSVLINTRASLQ